MHGIVSNLEKRGLVERKSDTSHGRILCTELTDQGHKVVAQAHDMIHSIDLYVPLAVPSLVSVFRVASLLTEVRFSSRRPSKQ